MLIQRLDKAHSINNL